MTEAVSTVACPIVVAKLPEIKSCKFNPTGTSILATTPAGFIIYALDRDGNVVLQHEYDVGTEIKFAERLYSTNLIAYATLKSPDVFVVFHCKRKKIVCDFRYPSDIHIIRFNRQRVIIAIKDVVYIHNVRNMQILHLIKDVPENPRNVMELACSENCGYVAFPWKAISGSVRIFDVFQLQDIACIQAHQSPLACVRFDPSGARIATSSLKGTCIRVFDSSHGQKLYEFRRGFKEVCIASLSFSLDSRYLSATSDSETIHVFKLNPASELGAADVGENVFLKSVRTATGLLSSLEERAFVTLASPLHGQNVSGFLGSLAGGMVNLMLTTPTGLLNLYLLEEGADGTGSLMPVKQHSLREVRRITTGSGEAAAAANKSGMTVSGIEEADRPFSIPPSNFDKTFEDVHAEVRKTMNTKAARKNEKKIASSLVNKSITSQK